jgi:hypothetical protein
MSAKREKLKALGGGLALLWFLTLCVYCFPWEKLDMDKPSAVNSFLRVTQMQQSWRMFRKPGTWNRFLIHEGITARGEIELVDPDTRPPAEPFSGTDYGRWRKVQYGLKSDSKHLNSYADWVCSQASDQVVSIRLRSLRTKKLTTETAQSGAERKRKESILIEQDCP